MRISALFILIGTLGVSCENMTNVETNQGSNVKEFTATAKMNHDCNANLTAGDDIQTAINNASAGDVICLEEGTYTPSSTITVTKDGLTIRGAGSGETLIQTSASSYGITTASGTSDIALKGFTLSEAGSYGLKMQFTNNLTLDDIYAINNSRTGIDLNIVNGASITNVISADTESGNGISIAGSQNITLINAKAHNNSWTGISLYVSSVDGNPGVSNVTISNSVLSDNGQAGLQVENSQSNDEFAFDNILVEGTEFSGNEGAVWIRGSQQMNLTDQNVNADGIAMHNNDLSGGVLHAGTGTLDATGNWWGHASGPGGPDGRTNPAGKTIGKGGDIVGNVNFSQWLRKSIDHPSN